MTDENIRKKMERQLKAYDKMGFQDAPHYKAIKDALKRYFGVEWKGRE